MMKKIIWLFATILFLINTSGTAQNYTIKGKIMDDATGEPVIFANILIKGTQNGTTTDLDGFF